MTREIIQVEQKVPLLKGIPLSLQHLFAMFGASILVPILFNTWAGKVVVDPALVLLMNGIGTLIYIFICHGKAPAFLGSSFASLAPTATCIAIATRTGLDPQIGFQRALGGFVASGAVFAAVAIVIAFFGHVSGAIRTLPTPVIGGVSIMLFGVIAASGLRMLVEARVDYSKSRNLIPSAVVFVAGISGVSVNIGQTQLKGMVLATLVGMVVSLGVWIFDKLGWSAESPDEASP